MNKQKNIAILCQKLDEGYGVRNSYLYYFSQFGKVHTILAHENPNRELYDLLVIPGGADLTLAAHNIPSDGTDIFPCQQGKDDPSYTYFDRHKLNAWREEQIPIFGICLGFQLLMRALGGDLCTHMFNHSLHPDLRHEVLTTGGDLVGVAVREVNSRHHQGCYLSDNLNHNEFNITPLALSLPDYLPKEKKEEKLKYIKGLVASGNYKTLAKDYPDTLIEAFKHSDIFDHNNKLVEVKIAGVQWHPEDLVQINNRTMGDYTSKAIIEWLLGDRELEKIPIAGGKTGPVTNYKKTT